MTENKVKRNFTLLSLYVSFVALCSYGAMCNAGKFRLIVLDAWGNSCAPPTDRIAPARQAAAAVRRPSGGARQALLCPLGYPLSVVWLLLLRAGTGHPRRPQRASASARRFLYYRFIQWMFTTPAMFTQVMLLCDQHGHQARPAPTPALLVSQHIVAFSAGPPLLPRPCVVTSHLPQSPPPPFLPSSRSSQQSSTTGQCSSPPS